VLPDGQGGKLVGFRVATVSNFLCQQLTLLRKVVHHYRLLKSPVDAGRGR